MGYYAVFEYAQHLPLQDDKDAPRLERKHGPAYAAIARRLREARKEAGLTQVEAAKLLKKPQSFISKCESGERRLDLLELRAFARMYGTTLAFFEGAAG